jgi:mono/diheme cytochrome c family protein
MSRATIAILGLALLGMAPTAQAQQQPAEYFRQNCMSCHTIGGGRLTGPDLKDVTQRKDRAWLERFVQNPPAVMESGDAYALQLKEDARGVVMPIAPGMSSDWARLLLDLIDAESKLPKSQFAGLSITDRPFTPAEAVRGRELFLGTRSFANGGAACVSCHTVGTLGGLGGGELGPDLTRVYERLGGRKATGTWLLAPATPTMQAVFGKHAMQPEEILSLLAFIEDAAAKGQPADPLARVHFFLLGFGGMVLGLVLLQAVWRERFRAVRRPLVRGGDHRGER